MSPTRLFIFSALATLGVIAMHGCAAGNTDTQLAGSTTTGTTGGKTTGGSGGSGGLGGTGGTGTGGTGGTPSTGGGGSGPGQLDLCVLNQGAPTDSCVSPAQLDFGAVAGGTQVMRLFRIDNDTGQDAVFNTVTIASNAFATVTVSYEPDPSNPPQLMRVVQPLPALRSAGSALFFEVTYTADGTAGPLPAPEVVVTADVASVAAPDTHVPIIGSSEGCPTGKGACDSDPANGCETDTDTSNEHCGKCAEPCFVANGSAACKAGVCTVLSCNAPFADCDLIPQNGCESNLLNGAETCGACNVSCKKNHTNAFCNGGNCNIIGCEPGFADCNLSAADGCETDVTTSMANCGGCNLACAYASATAACTAGACVFGACNPGFADCNADLTDGCEADLGSDPNHCGTCAVPCKPDHATPSCTAGKCGILTCDAGFADCDNDPANGCEIELGSDAAHCGTCAKQCTFANAGATCLGGTCLLGPCVPGFANCDSNAANGCETNTDTSNTSCGACGAPCSLANATSACTGGVCQLGLCNLGFADCDNDPKNGCEVNLKTSLANCGACGSVCDLAHAAETCNSGVCTLGACDPGFANCDGNSQNGCETDTTSSVGNCGSCGNVCSFASAGASCLGSTCVIGSCNAGYANCDNNAANGCETNTNTSLANCGACGATCSHANAGSSCTGGSCSLVSCNAGFADCDNNPQTGCEVNLKTSLANCGACGSVCDLAHAAETCNSGVCTLGACDPGFANCDGNSQNGCETDTTSSAGNCGSCGHVCSFANAGASCLGSTCVIGSCSPGFANCDNNAANGCETSTNTSLANCGACGAACSFANAGAACAGGSCTMVSCNGGFADCDADPQTGCEVNLNTSIANCGACGTLCSLANATSTCSGGTCGLVACNPGFANCDGSVGNGCETNTNTSVTSCGGCGNTCSFANASATCSGGACQLGTCNAGFSDCDGNPANGCETNIKTSLASCGGCGATCSHANAGSSCSNGVCSMTTCNGGFADCDGNPSNGCEVNTNTNAANCGGCGNACNYVNGVGACSGGTCALVACAAGYGSCDGNPLNGCETNTNTSLANCGACGNGCSYAHAGAMCNNGSCAMGTCSGGFADCDSNPANGCETDVTTIANCGTCGNACSYPHAAASCAAGSCAMGACSPGFVNCNGLAGDGCEINTQTDVNNCGGCGTSCAVQFPHSNVACGSGTCSFTGCQTGYWNLDGNTANGCEYACTFQSATDLPDDSFTDANCDGIDGDAASAIFVDTITGNDGAMLGTRATPMKTITGGIQLAQGSGKTQVYISNGTYNERVVLVSGISLYGGYSKAAGWVRSAAYTADIRGTIVNDVPGGRATAMEGSNILAPTTVDRLTIETLSVGGTYLSNYAFYCNNCPSVILKNSNIQAGNGKVGTAGTNGAPGSAGSAGNSGGNGTCDSNIAGAPGGSGGTSACGRSGGAGGKGGDYGSNAGAPGATGVSGTPGGNGGGGGSTGKPGGGGTNGASGSAGANGGGGSGGSISANFWIGSAGGNGTSGAHGNGGGGGGGGGGQGCSFPGSGDAGHGNGGGGGGGGGGQGCSCPCIVDDGNGNGGGGGGAGGCAGTLGIAGTAGGGSFGLFLVGSNGIQLINNTISSGSGGNGGAGGIGGGGGNGGAGAAGGAVCTGEVGQGGAGGLGGAGGTGGHGGGAAGGVSYAIYRVATGSVTGAGNSLANGAGGLGGTSPGNPGAAGASGTLF